MRYRRFIYLAVIVALVGAQFPFASRTVQAQTTLPTASQVASQITVGWNLGNTLEAICSETAWGNPMVTQQFINSVRAAGFNTIRIPASWDCHANQSTLTIDPAWMARVKQVVDYAHGQGMYVILNIHWDNGWLQDHPTFSFQESVNRKQRAYWTQIATLFRDYNERLLFAGTNEVHADFGTPTSEHITVQQSYLQTFVDAVRATGGNNATRTLVVQTYNTNIWHGLDFFTLPTDTVANRLIVEVHHYDPYDYTLNPSGSCLFWGAPYPTQSACTWAQEAYHDDLFARVKAEWIDQGIPVILGEYGVATRPNLNLESRQYYLRYVNQVATRNGVKTFYWDNGVNPSQTNGFALFDRNTGAIIDQGALNAIMQGVGGGNPTPTPSRTPTRTNTPFGPTNTPTRTATQPAGGQVLQAENASFGGGATADSNNAGFMGTGFINFPASGGFLQFSNVNGGAGGSVALQFRYALGASASRTGRLLVNGAAQNITFNTTGSWTTWSTHNVTVSLNAGTSNTLRLESTGQDLANVDQLTVSGGTGPTPTSTPTRTNTPIGPTPTRTNTPTGPTATPTRTPTQGTGTTCSPVTSTIAAPFEFNGAGTFCWQTSNLGSFVNSWNLASLTINGVDFTNRWASSGSYPPPVNGFWYVRYVSNVAWGHFEAR